MLRSRHTDLRSLADEELMEHVGDGHARAYGVLFDRHGGAAFSLAYRMCGRRAMAEDVVQEAFLSLWRSSAGYDRARGSVRSWVLGVVHNRGVDAFRRDARRESRDIAGEGIAEGIEAPERTEDLVSSRAAAEDLRRALAGPSVDQRRVIELAYFGGFTHSQVAASFELPSGAVEGRMRLKLAKLRLAFDEAAELVPAGNLS